MEHPRPNTLPPRNEELQDEFALVTENETTTCQRETLLHDGSKDSISSLVHNHRNRNHPTHLVPDREMGRHLENLVLEIVLP